MSQPDNDTLLQSSTHDANRSLSDIMQLPPIIAANQRREFPIDIWERVIETLASETILADRRNWSVPVEWKTLVACTLVCKAWYHRSWFCLNHHVTLRRREQVTRLFQQLRAVLPLRRAVTRVTIAGGLDSTLERLRIPHLGRFAAALARPDMLPQLTKLRIRHAHWRAADIPPRSVAFLDTFRSVRSLQLVNISFPTASQFGRLIAALPALTWLHCVSCILCDGAERRDSKAFLPQEPTSLRKLSLCEPVELQFQTSLIRFGEVHGYKLQDLQLEIYVPSTFTLESGNTQRLLDLNRQFLQLVKLELHILDVSPQMQSEALLSHVNLGKLKLKRLAIGFTCPLEPDYSWIAPLISTVSSTTIETLAFTFRSHNTNGTEDRMKILLDRLAQHADLKLLDDALASDRFKTLHKGGVDISLGLSRAHDHLGLEWISQQQEKWQELIGQKMPQSARRGILSIDLSPEE